MRPLTHLDIHMDMALFEANKKLYDELFDYAKHLIENAYEKHMGEYLALPRPTLAELKKQYNNTLNTKKAVLQFGFGEESDKKVDAELIRLHNDIQNKNYIRANDISDKKYREKHIKLSKSWEKSKVYEDLVCEIMNRNEKMCKDFIQNYKKR